MSSDPSSTGNQDFVKAAADVKNLSYKPSNDELLQLYAFFKQGIHARPGMLDFQGKAKWDAWTKIAGTSKEEAQAKYIALVKELQSKN